MNLFLCSRLSCKIAKYWPGLISKLRWEKIALKDKSYGCIHFFAGFPNDTVVKNSPAHAGATENSGSVPGLGRSPAEGNGNPIEYSCLGNPMDRRAWQATVYGVAKSWIRLSVNMSQRVSSFWAVGLGSCWTLSPLMCAPLHHGCLLHQCQ